MTCSSAVRIQKWVRSEELFNVRCPPPGVTKMVVGSITWVPCPASTTLAPHDAMAIEVTVPDPYVSQLSPEYRDRGIEFCLQFGGIDRCYDTELHIPPA